MSEPAASVSLPANFHATPPRAINRLMKLILRTPLLHRILSGSILMITFAGRKTGKVYSTPVGYHRERNQVTVISKRFRTWWKNFEEPAPVRLLIQRRVLNGMAVALTDVGAIEPILMRQFMADARLARGFGIPFVDGKPDAEAVRSLTAHVVIIQVTLDPAV
jgi:hypothetical protein